MYKMKQTGFFSLIVAMLLMLLPVSMSAAWSYYASGNILSAYGEGGYTVENPLSITISAPVDLQFDGNYKPATLSSDTVAWKAAGLTVPTILYDGKTNAPSMLGTYTASISAGGATAEVVYTIKTVIDYQSFFNNGITQGINYDIVPNVGKQQVALDNSENRGVYWDPVENCAVFDGQAYLQIDNPLGNVTAETGFTLTMDVWISSDNNSSTWYYTAVNGGAYRQMNGWQRLFDLSDGNEDHCIFINAGTSSHLGWCLRKNYGNLQAYVPNNTGRTFWNKWCTITLVVAPGGYTTLYVNGERLTYSPASEISKIATVMNTIHEFDICYIGTSIFEATGLNTDGFFIGKIRGFQTAEGALLPYFDGTNYHYLLSYETNGGNPIIGTFEATIPATLPTPTNSNPAAVFQGWFLDEALTIPVTTGVTLTQNTSLYAKWNNTVEMAVGTEDVARWSVYPTSAPKGTTITVNYIGSKTVECAVARRKYASIIDLNSSNAATAQNSFNSTPNSKIVVSEDFNANLTFTRSEGDIDMNGHANSGWFCVQNNVVGESVTIRNGSFLDIDGIGGWGTCYHGTIILENINCRNVFTDGHDYVIRGGAYENIHNYYNNGTPGTVTIYGGKFKAFNTDGHNPNGTLDGTYTLYGGMYKFDPTTAANCNVIIPNGYSVQLNPDIDNLDYPWVVVKTSDPLAQTSEPSFDLVKVGDNQWTFAMPAYDVEVEVTYVPDMSYTVEMASGTVDATNWNITSSPAQKGATVTLTYSGAMKVENVSLVKKSATQINASNASTTLQSSINSATEEHPYIVLTDNIPCLGNVFITKPEGTVDLSGYNMCANLYIQNDVLGKTLTLRNGHVQGGADGDGGCPGSRRGTVVLDNLVIDGTLWCDGHEFYIYNTTIGGELQNIQFNNYPSKVTIFSGKFNALRHSCGNITGRGQYMVYGGKFKENYADWNICAPGYSFQANTDEDAATYPYVVKPISPVNAKSAANPKKAPANQPGYGITEVTSNSEWTFTMPASDVEVLVEYGLHGQGTEEDPFTISSADEWNVFAKMVNGGESFAGKFIRQTADISGVTQAVGTGSNRFSGTYDGYEHTLTLDINTNANYAAPFALLSGATIKNLHTDGEINTGGSFAGGIVGEAIDGSTIVNCLSTVTLTSSKAGDCTHGGLIGVSNGTTIEGCVFNGSLYTTNNTINCGGLVGWSQTNQAKTIVTNCLFDPVDFTPSMATNWSSTIGRDGGNSGACYTITNTYYTQAFGYTHQGKLVRSITAGDNVTTLGMAGTATVYNVSGITAYADNNGLKYGDMFFAGDADVVNLTLGHADRTAEGLFFDSYSASNGATIIGDTLTVTTNNTIVSANYSQCPILTLNSDGNGTVGFSGGNLPQGVTPGSTANTYYVVPGTEVCIKATPAEHHYMQKWNNEAALNSNVAVSTTFTVTKDTTLTAYFVQKPVLTLGTNPSNPIRGTVTIAGNSLPDNVKQKIGTSSSYYVDYGTNVTVVATPIAHYHLASWSNIGGNELEQEVTMTSNMGITGVFAIDTFTLTLKTNDINRGTVEVTNHNGNPAIVSHDPDANGTRTYKVNYSTEVIIKATPKEHYHLDSWSNGSHVNTDDTIHVIVTTDSTITATFDTNTYVLNVVSADAAMGSVSGSNPAAKHFLSYEISATPNNGYHFVQWNDGNTDNPRTVTLSSDSTFTATFAVTPAELAWSNDDFTGYTYIDFNNWKPTLTNPHNVSVRYGCVEGNQSLQGGILCDAQTGTIGASSSVYGYIHSVAGTYHIYAVHETDQTYYYDSVVYTLHVLPSAQVSLTKNIADGGVVSMPDYTDESTLTHLYITVNGTSYAYVAQGYSVRILAEPATGYHFSKWTLDQSDLSTNAAYTYQAPATITGNLLLQYIQAVFDTNTYALNVVSADAEMGSVSGSNPEAKHFLSYEISATPNTGYHFVRWSDGNTDNPRMVTLVSDSNITAYFDYNEYTVTYMDGESMLHEETVKYLHSIPDYTTSKDGWDFIGWNPAVPQLMPAENLTVYAQWYRICEPVTDVDNNTYPTVNIGNKCWMAENLRTTHYADGREITNIYEYQNEMYPNVQQNVSIYGRLYDWYDAVDSARPTRATRVQGICPDGWYMPNEEDFGLLSAVDLSTLRSTNYWLFNQGTNTSGFDLRPAGMYNFATSRYEDLRGNAYLWSVSSISTTEAHCHMADCHCYMLIDLIYNKNNAFSVRCVKD